LEEPFAAGDPNSATRVRRESEERLAVVGVRGRLSLESHRADVYRGASEEPADSTCPKPVLGVEEKPVHTIIRQTGIAS
jgi:hypothetical protein